MIVNNHRKHSSFALKNFLAGGCYTPDAAYCLLYAQREQIEMDVEAGRAAILKQKAEALEYKMKLDPMIDKRNSEEKTWTTQDEIDYLRLEAEQIRAEALIPNFEKNYEGARRELKELDAILEAIKPQCKYWNEDILQMEQDMQADEWREELKGRAENMMLANQLGIGYDHLQTMRQHPDFAEHILPHIKNVRAGIALGHVNQDPTLLLKMDNATKQYELPDYTQPALEAPKEDE